MSGPRRARVDDEGADDHQGEQDVADLRAYDVHGCVLAGAGHATSAYAEVARRRRRQVAALATRPAVLGPCRFGTPRLLPVGTSERELRDIAFPQPVLAPADAAVVEQAGPPPRPPPPGP